MNYSEEQTQYIVKEYRSNPNRETVESSVGATDNDSILKARAENNPATLDKAPASFSRSNEIICFIIKQVLFRSTNAFRDALCQMRSLGKHFQSDR